MTEGRTMTRSRPLERLATGLSLLALTVATAACGGDASPGGSSGETKTVRIGYNADFNSSSLVAIANDRKLWAKHGLRAEVNKFTNGPLQVQAIGAGDLDVASLGPGALWLPASGKGKIIAVNSLGEADRLIAQPGITSVAGLKGKKVGVPEGTSGDMILQLALQKAGMTPGDIQKVAMDPNTIVSAFSSGQIDAAGIWYPLVGIIKKSKPDAVELAKNSDFYPDHSFPCAFIASNELVADDPATVRAIQRVFQEANDYRLEHLDESLGVVSEFIGVPEEQLASEAKTVKLLSSADLVQNTKDGKVEDWLNGLQKLFVQLGRLKAPTPVSEFYAGDLYVEAAG